MTATPLLPFGLLTLILVALFCTAMWVEILQLREAGEDAPQLGWWAPAEEQERLRRILERNPSYDERTGMTSDPELARWLRDNRP